MIQDLVNLSAGFYSGFMQAKGHNIHPEYVLSTYGIMALGEGAWEVIIKNIHEPRKFVETGASTAFVVGMEIGA